MSDTTGEVLSREEKFRETMLGIILRRIDDGEYADADHVVLDAQSLAGAYRAVRSQLESHQITHRILSARLAERDAEVERLRAANTVLRSALNWALEDGGWRLWYYGWDMPDTIKAGLIGNAAEIDEEAIERAVAAVIEGQSAALGEAGE